MLVFEILKIAKSYEYLIYQQMKLQKTRIHPLLKAPKWIHFKLKIFVTATDVADIREIGLSEFLQHAFEYDFYSYPSWFSKYSLESRVVISEFFEIGNSSSDDIGEAAKCIGKNVPIVCRKSFTD